MKQNFFTRLIIAVALFGLTHFANAQLTGQPWNEKWDSCMTGTPQAVRPGQPGGPYSYGEAVPLRIYENCPAHIDTMLTVSAGTHRSLIIKGHRFLDELNQPVGSVIPGLPKDHLGRHYLINTETGQPFSEFDEIPLPASTTGTPFPISFVHYPLTEGDPVYEDGYKVQIIFVEKIDGVEHDPLSPPTPHQYDYLMHWAYQYFEHPKATLDYQKPGPMFEGKFELSMTGELLQPENRVGYESKTSSYPGTIADLRDLSNFKKYTAGAYYSLDSGATWIEATTKTVTLKQGEIENLPNPDEATVLMRLPYGCQSFVLATSDGSGSRGRLPNDPFSLTRQITMDNQTGAVLEPLKQIYDVNSGNDFELTVRPTGNNVPVLETSRNNRIPDSVGVVQEVRPDGSYHFTIRKVKENLTVTLKYTVGNAEVDGTRVWGEAGTLCIASATTGRASVYNALGRLCRTLNLSAGETRRLPLPVGVYIVTMSNGRAYKAAVN